MCNMIVVLRNAVPQESDHEFKNEPIPMWQRNSLYTNQFLVTLSTLTLFIMHTYCAKCFLDPWWLQWHCLKIEIYSTGNLPQSFVDHKEQDGNNLKHSGRPRRLLQKQTGGWHQGQKNVRRGHDIFFQSFGSCMLYCKIYMLCLLQIM